MNAPPGLPFGAEMRLYSRAGRRLYLNGHERRAFRAAALRQSPDVALLCMVLLHTGCRVSEALALTRTAFQRSSLCVSIVTLKRRRPGLVREVPVPQELFALMGRIPRGDAERLLLGWHRSTAWRKVRDVLTKANIRGPQAMPKGLRHGFGVHAIQCGVPLNLLARWMGHASMRTTAIYADATGPEERRIAARMWSR
jgi:integrase